jgi:hypothetical protein
MEQLLKTSNAKVLSLEREVAAKDKIILELRKKPTPWSSTIENGESASTTSLSRMLTRQRTRMSCRPCMTRSCSPSSRGAVSSGLLNTILDCNSVLETGHILPAKSNDRPKPIIARFYSRNIRALVFRLKWEYAPTKTVTTSSSTNNRRGEATKKVYCYPVYEESTAETFNLLQALLKDPRTGPVWTISSNIRFKLQGEDTVRKVIAIYDSVKKILGR